MQLEELKSIWNKNDDTIENSISINHKLLQEVSIHRVHKLLASFKWSNVFELTLSIILSFIFIPLYISFVKSSFNEWPLLLSGAFLILIAILSIAYNLIIAWQINSIKYQDSIYNTQKKIEKIKLFEAFETNLLIVVIPLFTLSFTAFVLKHFINLNLFHYVNISWGYHFVGTLIITFIIIYLLKKFPNKKLTDAQEFLNEINELKRS